MKKKNIWLILKIAVSLALILFILMRVDLAQLAREIRSVNILFISFSMAIGFVAYLVNTYKWQRLLLILKSPISFSTLLALNFIGFFYTLFLSTQISGEVIKAIKLYKLKGEIPNVVSSITMDRLTGLLALVILFFLSIGAAPPFKDQKLIWGALAITLLAILAMVLILSRQASRSFERFCSPLFRAKRLNVLKDSIHPLWNSFKSYQGHLPQMGSILIYSLIYQLIAVLSNYFIALSIGIQIPFINLIWIVSVVSILQLLPLSIAGIGIREGAFIVILGKYGILYPKALTFSLIVFSVNLLMGLIGGGIEIAYHFKR